MTKSAQIWIDEATLGDLLAEAVSRRIARDFDTYDEIRSDRQMLRDTINGVGRADLRKYLLEILDGTMTTSYTVVIREG